MENDFFKDFGQKWKVRNGTVVFQKMLSSDSFFNKGLTMTVFRSRGTMPVVRDVLMIFVMVRKRMSRFYKEAWWEWDQVHKTWQMHC